MAREGYDYSWGRPSGASIKAAGRDFVVRYLFNDGQGGKGLDQSEINDLQANGIQIALVYEEFAKSFYGYSAGVTQAQRAQAALDKLSLDKTTPIYFACDWDTTEADQAQINEALKGAASVIGLQRVGIYGSYYVMERVASAGLASYYWQTYAWSGGQVSSHNHLYQYKNGQTVGGASVDFTRALKDPFGQTGVGTPSGTKSNEQIATEVIAGLWGNGDDRKSRLATVGYDYSAIQAIVNGRLGTSTKKSNETIANEVIAGIWGDGDARKSKLTAAGYDYNAIQAIVNAKVKGSTASGVTYMTIPSGSNLTVISKKYGSTVTQIVSWNKAKYPTITKDYIQDGWVIRVK